MSFACCLSGGSAIQIQQQGEVEAEDDLLAPAAACMLPQFRAASAAAATHTAAIAKANRLEAAEQKNRAKFLSGADRSSQLAGNKHSQFVARQSKKLEQVLAANGRHVVLLCGANQLWQQVVAFVEAINHGMNHKTDVVVLCPAMPEPELQNSINWDQVIH